MEIKNTLNPIDPYTQARVNNAGKTPQTANRAPHNAPVSGKETGDRVSLSPEAKLRTEAFTSAMNTPDVRAEKVSELKARVQSGEYTIDSKAIAAKLLEEEPGLFQP